MPPAVRSRRLRSAGMSDTSTVNEVDPARGLSAADVAARVAEGRTNDVPAATTRTVAQIVRANVFTRFNAILGAMLAIIVVVGPRAGRPVRVRPRRERTDRHRAGAPGQAHARPADAADRPEGPRRARRRGPRGRGRARSCSTTCSRRRAGAQIVVDGEVLTTEGLEVDESLLTGEAEPVIKQPGDEVRSGSFVAAGSGAVPRGQGRGRGLRGAGSPRTPAASPSPGRSSDPGSTRSSPTSRTRSCRPRRCSSSASSARTTSWRRGGVRSGGRHRGDGARGPRAPDLARVRGRRRPPRAAAGARAGAAGRRGTRARRRAVRRQDRHAHRGRARGRSGSTRSTGPMRTPLERALAALAAARRLPERDDARDRRALSGRSGGLARG